jgi:hypothetical protein
MPSFLAIRRRPSLLLRVGSASLAALIVVVACLSVSAGSVMGADCPAGWSDAPTGLWASVWPVVGTGQAKLTWSGYNDASSTYDIEWAGDSNAFRGSANTGSNTQTYTVSGLAAGMLYTLRVRRQTPCGAGSWSSTSATPPAFPPLAPTGLAAEVVPATGVGPGQVKLTWSAPSSDKPITDYLIQQSINSTTWTTVADGTSSATTYTVTGLSVGTQYAFRVAAVSEPGQGYWSAIVQATPPVWKPDAPSGLTAAVAPAAGVGSGQVKLTWIVPANNGSAITDYLLQDSTNGTTWTTVSDGVSTATNYTVAGLTNGTKYWFRVAAKNGVGDGPWTTTITATPVWVAGGPTGLTAAVAPATGVAPGQVKLAWTAPASTGGAAITDYVIESSLDGTNWTPVNDGTSTTTSYTVSGLTNGTAYTFRVSAKNTVGVGSPSSTVSATPAGEPDAPIVTATVAPNDGVGSGEVKLSWPAPANNGSPITAYRIEKMYQFGWIPVYEGPLSTTWYTVGGMANNLTWRFRVMAKNAVGWSPGVKEVQATPVGEPTVAPGGLAASVAPAPGAGSGEVRLSWDAAAPSGAGVTDYAAEWSADGNTWTKVDDGVSTDTSLTVGGLTNGRSYWFRVAAANQFGTGPTSTTVRAAPWWMPAVPEELTASVAPTAGVASGEVRLSWAAPADNGSAITDYLIEWSVDGDTWTAVDDGVSTDTTSTVGGLTDGTAYSFRVAAVNALGPGQPSLQTPGTPTWTPAAPEAPTTNAAIGSGQVRLTWAAPADHGSAITDYLIESSLDGTTWTAVDDGVSTATAFTVGGLTDGVEYSFRVAAVNAVERGGWSPPAAATPVGTPDAPGALTVNLGTGSGEVQLTWSAPADHGSAITDYAIEWSIDGVRWTVVDDGVSTATAFTVGGLTDGMEYSFRVAAVNVVGQSEWSVPAAATPLGAPAVPTGLRTTTGVASGQVRLNWTAPADHGSAITDYMIQRSLDGASWTTVNDGISATTTSTMRGLSNGTSYRFRVAAVNAVGSTPWSPPVQATPVWKPDAPRSLRAAAGSGRVRLTWSAPASNGSGITDYVVQRARATSWTTVRDGVSTARSFTVTRLANGTAYRFRVAAKNAVGQGTWSAVVRATPRAG